ncbi:tyrosine-type recombinase/integrase [Pseudomonas syringae group genomosp. 3]|uniref:Site-specific recombinase, phage integrase family n=1 Tax=Pseudomonas syringae pv. tomato (strain ATCC BAA-871 / DC3000) TaxID=223283 RepID=Q881N3_PSESM|nr:integrase [Pseudomonas syringae group genomosp. 3]AAO56352.1 site-specific recombinase, phage integrase family [Pseudomonas syringae pv. tomato str. DC3000]KPB88873.1 Site-specific recombinase [Pseudomonas syringae pv. maculicola]KPY87479.1 Site-specific recombinase, phage integrase family [Pseudomonas syringae pv. tomato]
MPAPTTLHPLFETYARFGDLNFSSLKHELPCINEYLSAFPPEIQAVEGYRAVRSFLKSYAGNESTFNSYRTHVERLLLWTLIKSKVPLLEMRRTNAEEFLEFCLAPDPGWVKPVVKSRFIRVGTRRKLATDTYTLNPDWSPFSQSVSKEERKRAKEESRPILQENYKPAQGSIAQIFAVCGSFFQHAIDEGFCEHNPFRAVKQKSKYKQRTTGEHESRILTSLQWDFVLETAEQLATQNPKYERTLFIVATIFAMYLRVSDLVGRENWTPSMGDLRKDGAGNWWYHVVGKGNKAGKISVRDDYVENYLKRWRVHQGLSPLPGFRETTPLIATQRGRAGLSDRHVRLLLQEVFDRALERMQAENWADEDVSRLRAASLHWLRHTSATFDAPYRDMKDLQVDLRHNSLSTTQNVYYNSEDEKRAYSIKRLPMKERT